MHKVRQNVETINPITLAEDGKREYGQNNFKAAARLFARAAQVYASVQDALHVAGVARVVGDEPVMTAIPSEFPYLDIHTHLHPPWLWAAIRRWWSVAARWWADLVFT